MFLLSLIFTSENINKETLFGNIVVNEIQCLDLIRVRMVPCVAQIVEPSFWYFHFWAVKRGFASTFS